MPHSRIATCGTREAGLQALDQHRRQLRLVARACSRSRVNCCRRRADGVVLLADADQFGHPGFERLVALAQHQHLALDQRDRAATVRMAQLDLGKHVGMLVEEVGMAVKPVGHQHVVQQAGRCWTARLAVGLGPASPLFAATGSAVMLACMPVRAILGGGVGVLGGGLA